MLKTVEFMSRKRAQCLPPSRTTAVISICGVGGQRARLSRFLDVLYLEFGDMAEEWLGIPEGLIPEVTLDGSIPFWKDQALPMAAEAHQAVAFIENLAGLEAKIDLVVHCMAGISRSAAIALYAAERYAVPLMHYDAPDTSGANPRMLRLLRKVTEGRPLLEAATAPDLEVLREAWR